jgi:hypothetical protein
MGMNWWNRYLQVEQYFWKRTYDGFGFFFHLESKGVDPWQVMERALEDHGSGNSQLHFLHLASGVDAYAIASWPMSYARKPAWGEDWDAQGKDIPPTSTWPRNRTEVLLDPTYTADLEFTMIQIIKFEVLLNAPARIRVENATGGFIVLGDEGRIMYQSKLAPGESRDLCFSEYCGCPGNGDSLNLINLRGARQIVFAGTGLAPGTNGHLVIEPAVAECCPGSSQVDPKMVGDWDLDVEKLLNGWPAGEPGETRSSTGSQTVHISANGTLRKSTEVRYHRAWVRDDGPYSFNYYVSGGVTACLQTRPYPGNPKMFFFKLTNVHESSRTQWATTAPSYTLNGHYTGEEIILAWGPRKQINNPNSDQSAYGVWLDGGRFGIRGSDVRVFRHIGAPGH